MDSKNYFKYWNYIEKRAFMPANESETKRWLRCFGLFIEKKFKTGDGFPKIKKESNSLSYEHVIAFKSFNVGFSYTITSDPSKFSILLNWQENILQFDYDSQYTCELDYLEKHCGDQSKEFSRSELEEVLKNKIWHPALHYHIKGRKSSHQKEEIEFPHEIRIGLVTRNPFLFLYQLTFQFLCLLQNMHRNTKKEKEFNRLLNVIFENKDQMNISPGVLFDI